MINLHGGMLPNRRESNPQPLDHQSDAHPAESPRSESSICKRLAVDEYTKDQSAESAEIRLPEIRLPEIPQAARTH